MQNEVDSIVQKLEAATSQKATALVEAYHNLHANQVELQDYKTQLDALLSSTSWRMTRGMRAVINLMRGGRSVPKKLAEPQIPPRITDGRKDKT